MGSPLSAERAQFELETLPHLATLLSSAQWLTMRSSYAEELVSRTMAHAYRDWDYANQSASTKERLFRILFREFDLAVELQQRSNRLVPIRVGVGGNGSGGNQPCFDSSAESDEFSVLSRLPGSSVNGAIARLSARSRFTMVLLLREQFSYAEIAYIVGLRVDTVKSLLTRLRRLISRYLIRETEGTISTSRTPSARLRRHSSLDDDLCIQ